jgi:2OG-Fe(II) oxygenase superfamily
MAAHETFEALSGALISDARILNSTEKELLANLFQLANRSIRPQDKNVPDALARMVGEIVTERTHQVMGSSITQQLLKQLACSADSRTVPMTLGGTPPTLPPGPSPNAPRPPGPTPGNARIWDAPMTLGGTPPTLPPGPSPNAPRPPGPTPGNARIWDAPMTFGGTPPTLPPGPSPNAPRPPGPTPGNAKVWEVENASGTVAVAEQPSVLPAHCVLLDEFLAPEELHELMQDTLGREMEFRISEVIAPGVPGSVTDFDHRRSRVLMELGSRSQVLLSRLQGCLPRALRKLGRDPFRPSRVEMQITASNDGDFFRWHSDNGDGSLATREITFVYFFHREPKRFRGGELRIYDSRWENGTYVPTENYRAIVPQQNQVVLFDSSLTHEITPVECPSQAFADSRFTANGWFHC